MINLLMISLRQKKYVKSVRCVRLDKNPWDLNSTDPRRLQNFILFENNHKI